MARGNQYVFSGRTNEAGLKSLNELKDELNVGWDEMVIDGMCGHYNRDKTMLMLPKKEATAQEQIETQKT